jgi:hypothetical protein
MSGAFGRFAELPSAGGGVSLPGFQKTCRPPRIRRDYLQPFRSHLSFALAWAVVCHRMLEEASAPPHASAFLWSMT